MTIYVTYHRTLCTEKWEYEYLDAYDMVIAYRVARHLPLTTLQGAYSLIAKIDTKKIISYFETVGAAEGTYWSISTTLVVPKAKIGQLSVIQDLDDGQTQAYFTDPAYRLFYARLGEPVEPALLTHVAIGEQLTVDLASNGMVAGVWMLDLPRGIGEKLAAKRLR